MVKPLGLIVAVSLLGIPLCAQAQGTSQQNGTRGGYVGTNPAGANSTNSNNGSSAAAPSRNSGGTGKNRTEGAYGLTPQHQKELGISRQQ